MESNMYKNDVRIISRVISCVKLKEHSYVTETKIHKDTFTCLWLEKCTFTSVWESMYQRPESPENFSGPKSQWSNSNPFVLKS